MQYDIAYVLFQRIFQGTNVLQYDIAYVFRDLQYDIAYVFKVKQLPLDFYFNNMHGNTCT